MNHHIPPLEYTLLPHRGVLRLSGGDARQFLQGLVTNDIRQVTPERAVYACLLSPQGKFLHDFFILEHHGALLLECERARAEDLAAQIARYRLRAKVVVELPGDSWEVIAAYGENVAELMDLDSALPGNARSVDEGVTFVDPRLADLGVRMLLPAGHHGVLLAARGMVQNPTEYERLRLSLGVPDGSRDLVIDRSLPLEFGLDALHAISFTKGCYVGQEVTARSKHRATLRKQVYIVQAEGGVALPDPGTVVMQGEKEAGMLLSHDGATGLALLRTDAVEHATGGAEALAAGNRRLIPTLPRHGEG